MSLESAIEGFGQAADGVMAAVGVPENVASAVDSTIAGIQTEASENPVGAAIAFAVGTVALVTIGGEAIGAAAIGTLVGEGALELGAFLIEDTIAGSGYTLFAGTSTALVGGLSTAVAVLWWVHPVMRLSISLPRHSKPLQRILVIFLRPLSEPRLGLLVYPIKIQSHLGIMQHLV
jgi:hypothetical protein